MKKKLPDILPCPCGDSVQFIEHPLFDEDTATFAIECRACDIRESGRYFRTDLKGRHKEFKRVIERWNKRIGEKR